MDQRDSEHAPVRELGLNDAGLPRRLQRTLAQLRAGRCYLTQDVKYRFSAKTVTLRFPASGAHGLTTRSPVAPLTVREGYKRACLDACRRVADLRGSSHHASKLTKRSESRLIGPIAPSGAMVWTPPDRATHPKSPSSVCQRPGVRTRMHRAPS